jgi:hypothetical protein
MNPADLLNKIPENFEAQCFENYGKIDKNQIWNNQNEKYQTYMIKINNANLDNLLFTQYQFILPYKKYISEKNNYSYSINRKIDYNKLKDNNKKTYFENNMAIS